ncbi:MAG: hypothetical protein PHG35_03515 [Dehalococcoidales bacterium]|nr:hypothetical protein [Dehalococcoidales bacterium]
MSDKIYVITLRVTPQEAKTIQTAARKDNRSVNQWAKLQLLDAAKNQK